jgi:hypothetical protein
MWGIPEGVVDGGETGDANTQDYCFELIETIVGVEAY